MQGHLWVFRGGAERRSPESSLGLKTGTGHSTGTLSRRGGLSRELKENWPQSPGQRHLCKGQGAEESTAPAGNDKAARRAELNGTGKTW